MWVIDASVISKLFLTEADSSTATDFVNAAFESGVQIVAPNLMKFEILGSALHFDFDFSQVLQLLAVLESNGLIFVEPTDEIWKMAEEIAQDGHKKSGYPALSDSLYHALAIAMDGQFITADKRHIAKTKQWGKCVLLADWRKHFDETAQI